MSRATERGLTIIELMVALTLVGIMFALAGPFFTNWTQNARVRTANEEFQNALRMAQAEAVTRNRQVAFVRTNATPARNATPAANGVNWYIQVLPLASEVGDADFDAASYVQGGSLRAANGVTVSGPTLLCFNSVGRLVANASTGLGADCATPTNTNNFSFFDVSLSGSDRTLSIEVSLGGRVRACDLGAASGQPQACTTPRT